MSAPVLASCPRPLAEAYDVALLDLDGVVYTGPVAVPSAPSALAEARRRGMRLSFVTNNASRPPQVVADHLSDLGVPAVPTEVVTSAQAAAGLLAEMVPSGSPVLVVGGAGLREAVVERGLRPVASAEDSPVAVVQGYDPGIGWRDLAEATYAVARGLPWVASNLDLTLPTARGIAPGNGTLIAAVQTATGRAPVAAGKPELPLYAEAVGRSGARAPLVVGDRLDTDIEGATRAGTHSLLVFTGVARPEHLLTAPPEHRPTYVADDLGGLLTPHPAPVADGGVWTLGGWRATVEDDVLRLDGTGERLDGLRVACAAVWARDGAGVPEVSAALGRLSGAGASEHS